jgi:hypothetical protein
MLIASFQLVCPRSSRNEPGQPVSVCQTRHSNNGGSGSTAHQKNPSPMTYAGNVMHAGGCMQLPSTDVGSRQLFSRYFEMRKYSEVLTVSYAIPTPDAFPPTSPNTHETPSHIAASPSPSGHGVSFGSTSVKRSIGPTCPPGHSSPCWRSASPWGPRAMSERKLRRRGARAMHTLRKLGMIDES